VASRAQNKSVMAVSFARQNAHGYSVDTAYGYALWGLISVSLLGLGLAILVW
jgi:hypothetical protein